MRLIKKQQNIPDDRAPKVLQSAIQSVFDINGWNFVWTIFDAYEQNHLLVHNELLFLFPQLINHSF